MVFSPEGWRCRGEIILCTSVEDRGARFGIEVLRGSRHMMYPRGLKNQSTDDKYLYLPVYVCEIKFFWILGVYR